eukprot:scaffold255313_cov28-Tisochrysis_lutea.AAC.3
MSICSPFKTRHETPKGIPQLDFSHTGVELEFSSHPRKGLPMIEFRAPAIPPLPPSGGSPPHAAHVRGGASPPGEGETETCVKAAWLTLLYSLGLTSSTLE